MRSGLAAFALHAHAARSTIVCSLSPTLFFVSFSHVSLRLCSALSSRLAFWQPVRRALVLGMGGYGSTAPPPAVAAAAATAAAGTVAPASPSPSPVSSIPQSLPPLAGTVATAHAVGAHLRSLYFECTVHADQTHAQAAAAVATFVHSLRQGDLALLHFSGYAASGSTAGPGGACAGAWLLPVDFEPGAPVDQGALSLDALLYQLVSTPAASVLVLLDAHPPPAPASAPAAAHSLAAALARGSAAPPNGIAHVHGGQLLPLRSVQLPDDGNLLVAFTTRTAHHAPVPTPAPAPIQLPMLVDPFAVPTSGPGSGSGSGSGPASAGSSTPGGVAASASPPLSFSFAPSPPGSASKPLQQQQPLPNGLLHASTGTPVPVPTPVSVDFVSSVLRPLCLPGVHVEAGCMHANRALQHASGRSTRLCWTSSLVHELILDPVMDEQPHAFNTVRYY